MRGSVKLKVAKKRTSEFFDEAVDEQNKQSGERDDERKREAQSEGEDVRAKEPRGGKSQAQGSGMAPSERKRTLDERLAMEASATIAKEEARGVKRAAKRSRSRRVTRCRSRRSRPMTRTSRATIGTTRCNWQSVGRRR